MFSKTTKELAKAVTVIQCIILGLLLTLLVFGIINFLFTLISLLRVHLYLTTEEIYKLLDIILILFINIELFRITLAYAEGKSILEILNVVLEAGFVAIARKMVLFDYPTYGIWGAVALAVLLLAVAIAYFLIGKTMRP